MQPKPIFSEDTSAALAGRTSVVVVEDFNKLHDYIHAWEDLADHALEQNPFYEPWMLIPALKSFTSGANVRVVLVFALDQAKPLLCGVFPVEKKTRYKKLPVAALSLWRHIYSPLCTPLIRTSFARECMDAFLDWLAFERECALMDFNLVSGDGPFQQILQERLTECECSSLVSESYTRALFRPRDSADQYLRAALNREHRKDLRRRTRRLSERGQLEVNALEPDGNIDHWIEEFLDLELRGWKGKNGGAFACNDSNRNYFVTIARAAFERGRMMMLALRLDGRPIAMKWNIISAPGSFAFKIAFDENYSAYSPGVLLELENIRLLHDQRRVDWMDSCAAPDHPMIDRLWLDRRVIQSVLAPTGKRTGEFVISALPLMRALNRKVRGVRLEVRSLC